MSKKLVVLTAVIMLGLAGLLQAEEMKAAAVKADTMVKDAAVQADIMAMDAVTEGESVVKEGMIAGEGMASDSMEEMGVNNKICPIEGNPIKEGEAVKVEHNGKIYNLCCSMCVKKFNEDPEKAISSLPKEGEKATADGDAAETEMKDMDMDTGMNMEIK